MRLSLLLLAVLAAVGGAAARADESALTLTTLRPTNTCAFFRGQAWGKGLNEPETEMLWACEAIAQRRAAQVPLGVRLEATDAALTRYREALHDTGTRGFGATSGSAPSFAPPAPAASDRRALAESTGVLAALMAIAEGY